MENVENKGFKAIGRGVMPNGSSSVLLECVYCNKQKNVRAYHYNRGVYSYCDCEYGKKLYQEYKNSLPKIEKKSKYDFFSGRDKDNLTEKDIKELLEADFSSSTSKYNDSKYIDMRVGYSTIKKFIPGIKNFISAPSFLCLCDCGRYYIRTVRRLLESDVATCEHCGDKIRQYFSKYDSYNQVSQEDLNYLLKVNINQVNKKVQPYLKSDYIEVLKYIPTDYLPFNANCYICKCKVCGDLFLSTVGYLSERLTCGKCLLSPYMNKYWINKIINNIRIDDAFVVANKNGTQFKCTCLSCNKTFNADATLVSSGYKLCCSKGYMPKSLDLRSARLLDDEIYDLWYSYHFKCDNCNREYYRVNYETVKDLNDSYFICTYCDRYKRDKEIYSDSNRVKIKTKSSISRVENSKFRCKKYVGTKQGKLYIKDLEFNTTLDDSYFICDCECGNKDVKVKTTTILKRNTIHSCRDCVQPPNRKYQDKSFIGKEYNF